MNKDKSKKIIGYAWFSVLIIILSAYFLYPQTFNVTNLILTVKNNYWLSVLIFSFIICFRGLLLISPLSLTLASSVFFPPLTALIVNSFGILISTSLIYKFSHFLGFDQFFEKNYNQQISKIKIGLHKKEIPIILLWSFLPISPTDLIVYVSASIKIPLWKCLVGVFVGTIIINAIFIYSLNFFLPY